MSQRADHVRAVLSGDAVAAEAGAGEAADPDEQLRIRIAWYYHVGGLTQGAIADKLGLTRLRVNRILAACHDEGLVQISIRSNLAACIRLEDQLARSFGLDAAVVVPSPEDDGLVQDIIGHAAGHYLAREIPGALTVGIGWGRTLRCSLKTIAPRRVEGLTMISLMGGVTHGSAENTFELVSRFGDLFEAERYYMTAPVFASDRRARDLILAEPPLQEIYTKARRADMAVISVGDLSRRSLLVRLTDVQRELGSLRAAGAVGDILGNFLDETGSLVEHTLNERAVSLSLNDLRGIDKVVLVSGGLHKVPIMLATLRAGVIDVVITDEATAQALIERE